MIAGTFCAWLPPPSDPAPLPDPPPLGAPSEVPDEDDDDLEALAVLGILFRALLLGYKRRLFWRF